MRTCACGGIFHRHGKARAKNQPDGMRYRCVRCGRSITIREGSAGKPGRPMMRDWRMERP